MKKQDLLFIAAAAILFSPFFVFESAYNGYVAFNAAYPYVMAFLKFALLATAGELIGLRIKTGSYNEKGFGILPRAIIWGLLGMWIAASMKIFSTGVPHLAQQLGLDGAAEAMKGEFSSLKLITALLISTAMNSSFGPVFMTMHKITDSHILANGGSVRSLITPIPMAKAFVAINWDVQWNFVFKKTIPFFWIPAHTLTFMLPTEFQVLFAALLGVALGVILSMAAVMSRQ